MQNRKRGFTAVESLVVLGGFGAMAAIFGRGMDMNVVPATPEGRRSSCQSNLKQMALGVMQYAQDYDELHPRTGVVTATIDDGWARNIQPYLKSYQIMQCPSEAAPQVTTDRSARLSDYYYNGRLTKVSQSQLKYSSNTVLFGDGEAATSNYACASFDHCIGRNIKSAVGKVPREAKLRHETGANYAFTDGHVKWVKPADIKPVMKPGVFGFTTG
ncbi:MAG TPA: DUF1559 domain-containing protein [Abditibacteriaceae bacterium]